MFKLASVCLLLFLTGVLFSVAEASWAPSSSLSRTYAWAVGDSGVAGDAEPTSDLLQSRSFRYLMYLGDVYETGSASDFQNNYGFADYLSKTLPTIGNHEWANRETGYYPYWQAARGSRPPSYYKLWISGWQVFVLNSEDSVAKQSAWLRSSLRKSKKQGNCRVLVSHRPRWSAGSHGSQVQLEPWRKLVRGKARVWLSGHDHNMQHIIRGKIHQFVSGAAGRGHYSVSDSFSGLRFANTTDDGALRLLFQKGRAGKRFIAWKFISTSGGELRAGKISCQRL